MNWKEAKSRISKSIYVGLDLNSKKSKQRRILGYNPHGCFVVSIGRRASINIPWNMLKNCFDAMIDKECYDGRVFRSLYPREAKVHPCYVHVIGQIFVVGKIVDTKGKQYFPCQDIR